MSLVQAIVAARSQMAALVADETAASTSSSTFLCHR
jgi:hypothetical protein